MVRPRVAEDQQVGLRGERVGVQLGEAGERTAVVGAAPQARVPRARGERRPSSRVGSAPGVNRSVTSWISSTKVNARTRLNCSRSAKTSISVKLAKFATEPLTSQSTTRSLRPGRLGLWCVSSGTPPLDIEARTVRRKSSGPRVRACLLAAEPGRQPSRQRLDLAAHQLQVGLAGGGEVDLLDRRAHGVARDVLRGRGPRPRGGVPRRRPAPRTPATCASTSRRSVGSSSHGVEPSRSPASTLSTSSSGETRFITLYDDHRCSPGPRPRISPNRWTASRASIASASGSPIASAVVRASRNSARSWRTVAGLALAEERASAASRTTVVGRASSQPPTGGS